MMRLLRIGVLLALAFTGRVAQAQDTLRIAVQPGLSYLVFDVLRHRPMLEERLSAAGAGPVRVEWTVLGSGAAINDAVLAGTVDVAATGLPAFIILWSKARGANAAVGLASYGSVPAVLVSSNPAVRSVADLSGADRIALPAVHASLQAILLSMAAEKAFGPGHAGDFDPLTVSLGHPEAQIALLSGKAAINAHFSGPPFYVDELKHPGMHVVLRSEDIFGGPLTSGVLWTTRRRLDRTPQLAEAVVGAVTDAVAFIRNHTREAAQFYAEDSGSRTPLDEVVAQITSPDMVFEATPRGIGQFAAFMQRSGTIGKAPAAWGDLFAPAVRALPGS